MAKLTPNFLDRKTELVAEELLGKVLVRKINNGKLSGMIVETEAYIGPHDLASHASKGKTGRTQVMFSYGGIWYVYMIYGFYYCLNIVTETKDYPSAVLIRALEPLEGIEKMKENRKTDDIANLTSGPGKLCQAFEIKKNIDGTSAISKNSELYIEDCNIEIPADQIVKAKRIGVDYAGIWKDKLLRFYIKDNPFVSRK
jgi:DNA-3-methyladenine glycosylase